MARLIFKAPYYKPKGKVNRGGYAKYIATREGVEHLRSGMADYIKMRGEARMVCFRMKVS